MTRLAAPLAVLLALLCARCTTSQNPAPAPPPPDLSYDHTRAAYNARAHRLTTLNTRGALAFQYTDEDGELAKERGDLNLRIQQPHNLALVVKKLGETYIWLGADRDRYWLINLLAEPSTAIVGRHDIITPAKRDALTLPVPPRDLLHLLALEPLPPTGTIEWDAGNRRKVVRFLENEALDTQQPTSPGHLEQAHHWRIAIDPDSNLPTEITLLDADSRPVITATLDQPKRVQTTGPVQPNQPPDPITPADVIITRPGTDEYVRLTLDGLTDRPANPTLFDLDARLDALQPQRIIDIDRQPIAPPDQPVR